MTFEELVARQGGLVSLAQAVVHGYSADRVHRRVREGRWRRLHPAVFLVGGHRLTDEVRVRAAWLWAGESAAICGPAAAYWHGLPARAPTTVDLTVPSGTGPRARPGVRLHRRDLDPADVVAARGLRLTGPALSVLETAVAVPGGSAFLDRALQRHVPFAEVYRAYCRGMGRRGWAAVHRMLAAAADRADSDAERMLVAILRGARLDGWVLGLPFGMWTVDLAFPAQRVAVEVDGWAFHVDQPRFAGDRHKGNALVNAGWTVLRFTWHDLYETPARVRAEIEVALASRMIAASGT